MKLDFFRNMKEEKMKRIQGKKVVGYITIHMRGEQIERFLQLCSDQRIPIWNIKKITHNHCIGTIYYHHYKKVKQLAFLEQYEIYIENKEGFVAYILHFWKRKELLFAILFSLSLLIVLSNIAWKVDIKGVPPELEEKISAQLEKKGLYEGAFTFNLAPLNELQKQIADEIPEVLYVGIEKKGTAYIVQAEEKLIVEQEKKKKTQNLIANKNGVIQKMFVESGQPLVRVNDVVKKGDILVTGNIETNDFETEEDENSKKNTVNVPAEGKVYANTWYEVNISSSLYPTHEKLSGEKITKYYIPIQNFQLPIWNFWKEPYKNALEEIEKQPIYFLKWELPINILKKVIYNKETFKDVRSEEEARSIAIDHALYDLQIRLGRDTEILKYYVLHESIENGKVKLNLYISVLENIAESSPIH